VVLNPVLMEQGVSGSILNEGTVLIASKSAVTFTADSGTKTPEY